MADGPFANAGLGMFGNDKSFAQTGMQAPDDGKLKALLGLALFPGGETDYSLAAQPQGSVPPAMGQGLGTPSVPGGIGMNPQQRSGMGMTFGTGMQAPATMPGTAPAAPAAPAPNAGQGLDLLKSLSSFWGV
jgi:hypothetical protein